MEALFGVFTRQGARLLACTTMHTLGWYILCLVLCLTSMAEGAIPTAPRNLTLVPPLRARQARITWSPGNPRDNLTDYVIVNRADGSDTKTVSRIDPEYTSFTLGNLKVETSYLVYVKAARGNIHSKESEVLEFRTPRTDEEYDEAPRPTDNQPNARYHVFSLLSVLFMWIFLVVVCFKYLAVVKRLQVYHSGLSRYHDKVQGASTGPKVERRVQCAHSDESDV